MEIATVNARSHYLGIPSSQFIYFLTQKKLAVQYIMYTQGTY